MTRLKGRAAALPSALFILCWVVTLALMFVVSSPPIPSLRGGVFSAPNSASLRALAIPQSSSLLRPRAARLLRVPADVAARPLTHHSEAHTEEPPRARPIHRYIRRHRGTLSHLRSGFLGPPNETASPLSLRTTSPRQLPRVVAQCTVPGTVALTFDDGPNHPITTQLLDILDAAGAKATFFVVGHGSTCAYDFDTAGVLHRMLRSGHQVGSHTYTHSNLQELHTLRGVEEEMLMQ